MNLLQKSLSSLGLGLCVSAAAVTIDPAPAQAQYFNFGTHNQTTINQTTIIQQNNYNGPRTQWNDGIGTGCYVGDPNDTYVNVRRSPNGALIQPLQNRSMVRAGGTKLDHKGQPWRMVTLENGTSGWVLGRFVGCH